MLRALELSEKAVGLSNPNPPVGAVLVKDGAIVGEGFTGPPGTSHAEKNALEAAGEKAAGASLYVTLEPCSHYGRTSPCVDSILGAGVERVFVSILDPDSRVDGNGIAKLKEGGVEVHIGDMADESSRRMEAHIKLVSTGLPFVTVKFAASLDGKIATSSGESQWITSELSRTIAHKMRSQSDSVMVGIGTVLADNPRLTARGADLLHIGRQPIRVVVDSNCRIPPNSALLSEPGETIIATTTKREDINFPESVTVESFPSSAKGVEIRKLLEFLGQIPISSVFVEGGSQLIGTFFDEDLVDKVMAFIAPVIIGGTSSPGAVAGAGAKFMSEVVRLDHVEIQNLGADVLVSGYRVRD